MNKEQCYEIGYVIKTHGLHGEVLVQLDVDDSEEYEGLESVFVEINNRLIPFFIDSFHLQDKGKAIVKFEDIDTIDTSQPLKGKKLFLTLNCLPELENGEYYLHDIIDFKVVDKNLGSLGKIVCYHTESAQTLLEMEYKNHGILIPVTDEIVLDADHTNKVLNVNLPNGLLEVYLEDTNKQEED